MQYQVPQFIETEDKIVGPFTFKQFVYITIPTIISTLLYFFAPISVFVILMVILMGLGATLAFVKTNGRPIILFFFAFLNSAYKPDVYILKAAISLFPGEHKTKEEINKMSFFSRLFAKAKGLHKNKTLNAIQPKIKPRIDNTNKKSIGGVNALNRKMATSITAIPKRERPLPQNFGIPRIEANERLEVVRHNTGRREVARRVDYR